MIATSLDDMNNGRDRHFAPENVMLGSAHCSALPACAVVVATYRTSGWGRE